MVDAGKVARTVCLVVGVQEGPGDEPCRPCKMPHVPALEAGWQGRHCCWVVLGVGSHASTLRCRRGGGSLQLRALCLLLHHIFPLAGLLSASPQMRPCPQCWWTATPPSDAPSWTSCSGGCRAVLRCASWCCNVLGCDAMCCDLLGCAGLSCAALGCDVPRPLLDEMVGGPA